MWREPYENSGLRKPGQASAGSGTTPTLMGSGLVAITDNADPMNCSSSAARARCRAAPDLPAARLRARRERDGPVPDRRGPLDLVENNHGYGGPAATQQGRTTSPGLERVDLDAGGGCRSVWRSAERAPTVVPKLSAANGLVYTYTKDPQASDPSADAWYLTTLDFESGRTVYKALAGEGLGHNNNYAPVTLGPDGTAYVGVLGGLISLRDRVAPPGAQAPTSGSTGGRKGLRRLRLHVRRLGPRRARLRVMGGGTRLVRRVDFYRAGKRKRVARDRRRPFRRVVRVGRRRGKMRARILLLDGRRVVRTRRMPAARRARPRG